MAIYTRTGDKGQTSLFGGKRVSKSDPAIEACGTIDELTSSLGVAVSKLKDKTDKLFLIGIQKDLYEIMATLAGGRKDLTHLLRQVTAFEQAINRIERKLPKLTRFLLPGGNERSSWFHLTRAISRRAERQVIRFFKQGTSNEQQATILQYLNRLSDLLFMMARKHAKGQEVLT